MVMETAPGNEWAANRTSLGIQGAPNLNAVGNYYIRNLSGVGNSWIFMLIFTDSDGVNLATARRIIAELSRCERLMVEFSPFYAHELSNCTIWGHGNLRHYGERLRILFRLRGVVRWDYSVNEQRRGNYTSPLYPSEGHRRYAYTLKRHAVAKPPKWRYD